MSELFGPLPRHAIAGVPLAYAVASPLLAAALVALFGPWLDERAGVRGLAVRAGARTSSDLVAAAGALASALVVAIGLVEAASSPSRMVVSQAWVLARVGSIDATLGFDLDLGRGALALVFAIGAAIVALRGTSRASSSPAGWRALALAAALAALLADGLATAILAVGGALLATGAASLRGRWLAGGAAVLSLTLAGATLAWGLDGRWLDGLGGNFLSDYGPRFIAVRDGPPTANRPRGPAAGDGRGSLTMTSAPGTEVFVGVADDASLRGRSAPLATSPFSRVPVTASLQKVAMVPGAAAIIGGDGIEIAMADVDVRAGDDIVLAPIGATWTFRDLDAQLLLRDLEDKHPLRSELADKRVASMSMPTAILVLAFLAAALVWLDGPRRIARALVTLGPLDAALVAATLAVVAIAPATRLAPLVPLAGIVPLLVVAAALIALGGVTLSSRGNWFAAGIATALVGASLLLILVDAPPVVALAVALLSAVAPRFAEPKVRRVPHAWIAGPAEDDLLEVPGFAIGGTPAAAEPAPAAPSVPPADSSAEPGPAPDSAGPAPTKKKKKASSRSAARARS